MANKIKKIIINIFGDGFFGLENNSNTQEEITNGYRKYEKKHKKTEPEPAIICYAPYRPQHSTCSVMGAGLTESCNDRFIESHFE